MMKDGGGWLRRLRRRASENPRPADIGLYASSGAYYLFFSLAPLIALLLSVLPYTPLTQQELLDAILPYVPDAFGQLIRAVVSDVYTGSLATLSLSLVMELWSAGQFFSGIVNGLSAIVDGETTGYFRRRLMGTVYTLALVLFILANLMLLLFGNRLKELLQSRCPDGAWAILFRLRGAVFFVGATAVIALLFRCAPKRKLRYRRLIPGAAFSAAAWLVFTRGYSRALKSFGLFGVYGSIAAVIISLFWIYCSLYILFFGAWLNTLRRPERE